MRINIPKWFLQSQLERLVEILGGNECTRVVGGTVRDILLNRQGTDIDLATTLQPEVVQRILQEHGMKAIPTGLQHGTITGIYGPNLTCEITTLRRDVACDGRRAKVEFTDHWEEDAKRRDFTINSMFMDMDGNIYDYCEGLVDIERLLVRFVGDPAQRIEEDALRILRYFRLYSYLGGGQLDQASLQAALRLAPLMQQLSHERIRNEMLKLLTNPYAKLALELMFKHKIVRHIGLNDILIEDLHPIKFGSDPLANLAALLRFDTNPGHMAQNVASSWRLSNKERRVLDLLCTDLSHYPLQHLDAPLNIHKRQLHLLGPIMYMHYVMLLNTRQEYTKMEELRELSQKYEVQKFPLSGHDFLRMGLQRKEVGAALDEAKQLWLDSDFALSHKELLQIIGKAFDNKRS